MEAVFSAERRFLLPEENNGQAALLGNSCSACERMFFPARSVCPYCWDPGTLSPYRFSGRTVFAHCFDLFPGAGLSYGGD